MAIIIKEEAFTFDDVLLQPQFTMIESRKNVDTSTRLTKDIKINMPIISANMDTITECPMMLEMDRLGGCGFMHRFMDIDKMFWQMTTFRQKSKGPLVVSVGINGDVIERLDAIKRGNFSEPLAICIDVAHGDCVRMLDLIQLIKEKYGFSVIAGNVATASAVSRLCNTGADAVKVGIGPGSMCSTRIVTGCGTPQLTAILECVHEARNFNIPIIADGGITKSGDIVKALAAGAESVMIGGLLAGTDETPGEIINECEVSISPIGTVREDVKRKYKKYRGMASRDAQIGWKGDYHATPEGESKTVECKGPVANVINDLLGGIRSGMTYCNAGNLSELRDNSVFRRVSSNTLIENRPHAMDKK